jgi:hypothetical protein
LDYLDETQAKELNGALEEVSRILNGLIRSARRRAGLQMLALAAFFAASLAVMQ